MAIINVILGREEDPIESIQIMNPYIYGEKPYMKGAVLDIKALTSRGELLDIEMQNGNLDFYTNRSVFYCGKLVNLSLEKGEDYDKMKKSIVISIVKGNVLPQTKKLHSKFYFMEEEEHFKLSEIAEIHFVELEKVDANKPVEEMNPLERLAAYMLYAGDQTREKYVEDLIEQGGEAVTMAEILFKELTEDQIAFEMREQQIKTEHSIATLRFVEERRRAEDEKRRAELDAREEETEKRRAELDAREAEIGVKEAEMQEKEVIMQKKELVVAEREENLKIQQQLLREERQTFAMALKQAGTDSEQISGLTGLSLEEIAGL